MIPHADQIERWQNAERVLTAMPEHERQHHWDMSVWGRITDCGTIHCAAGACGLDPWFRERGFKLDFNDGEPDISSPEEFFGVQGTTRIFLNTACRPVETVIQEVHGYVDELRTVAELTARAGVAIGEEWPAQGGIFAGAMLGRGGQPNYYLIIGPDYGDRVDWRRAMSWASELSISGLADFHLPFREEQLVLFDRVRSLFERDWYWSCEQYSSYDAYVQSFLSGGQDTFSKGGVCRARAVRSLIIQ
jgi:hypothetical protein